MFQLRHSSDRGHAQHGWLDSRHTFSFADYHDPAHMGFRSLRVVNEDRVEPARGFGTHGHRDMEIVTYVLEGELKHEDSMGNGSTIRPGEVQRMSAGAGVRHSETNPSAREPVHFLQIWIVPAERGLTPSYEQRAFPQDGKLGKLRVVASPDGREGSVTLHADAVVYDGAFEQGQRAELPLAKGRGAWVHLARGRARVNGRDLEAGDGAAIEGEPTVTIEGVAAGEVLVFDLA
ncbi:MAG: pirin family protein [Myxococcales bacterium]